MRWDVPGLGVLVAEQGSSERPSSVGKSIWQAIKTAFHGLGLVTNFLLLAVFYFLPIGVYAIIARLLGRDFLDIRRHDQASFWKKRPAEQPTLERARRQS
jgi:Na+-driven multidrug efflux pump